MGNTVTTKASDAKKVKGKTSSPSNPSSPPSPPPPGIILVSKSELVEEGNHETQAGPSQTAEDRPPVPPRRRTVAPSQDAIVDITEELEELALAMTLSMSEAETRPNSTQAPTPRTQALTPGTQTPTPGAPRNGVVSPSEDTNSEEDEQLAIALAISASDAETSRSITQGSSSTAANTSAAEEAEMLAMALTLSMMEAKEGEMGAESAAASSQQNAARQEQLYGELQCPVCLELFNQATTLGCGHTFCSGCLQETRASGRTSCPLCRAPVTSATRSVTLDNIVRSMASDD